MEGCVEHEGRRTPGGYGKVYITGHEVAAHRLAWEAANGPIPGGLSVLHRCDNPPCVNPDHLFLGTQADNVRDSVQKGRHRNGRANPYQSGKTHCVNGHEFTSENTYVYRGTRACRTCREETRSRFRLRQLMH